ncbi:MAG: Transcriptional regulatory protein KdpE [Acidobacteria bacterium]|nr:Transcriptional regulatory protein KdpE [Acidobacteriota bacterium]
MMKKPVILVVDDEMQILRVMRASLPARGYEVRTAPGGEEAIDEVRKEEPDLIILDLVMPKMSGLEVCRRVREFSNAPIIVLSAKEAEADKVAALELGADDYVTKPFGLDELLARMHAILRRVQASTNHASVFTVGDVAVDADARRVTIAGREVKLTPKEFEVLKHLVSNAGKVVTHRSLLLAVWGVEATDQTDYLRVFINQLRRKIEPDPPHPRYIITEPWVGYRFVPNE